MNQPNLMPDPCLLSSNIRAAKQDLRRKMQAKRAEIAARNPEAAKALCAHALRLFANTQPSVIASYHARDSEMNPALLTQALCSRNHSIVLPVLNGRKEPLLFRRYTVGDALVPGHFGLSEPGPDAEQLEPAILLVPLLAFDKNMGRLGYGGGYYDRTLSKLRQRQKILAIGLAYAEQEVPEIPMSLFDMRLDYVVTEKQVFQQSPAP